MTKFIHSMTKLELLIEHLKGRYQINYIFDSYIRIFITTGSFSRDALEFSSRIDSKIVLIDVKNLVDLMIDHNIGVSVEKSYEKKKIDSDYFEEAA